MAGNFSLTTVLANLAAGNQALSLIDGDFNSVYNPLVSLNTFSNYYVDGGAANAYTITVSSPQTVSQAAGLMVQFIAAHVNTGASTLQINALAAKNILNPNGSALSAGQIPANGVVSVVYDGTQYVLIGGGVPQVSLATATNSLSGDVALNNTGSYFDGPSVAAGAGTTFFASGTITITDTAGAAVFNIKLWDGTTVVASTRFQTTGIVAVSASLSGRFTSPAGNIRISVNDQTSTSGAILFNASSNSKDSTITVLRIA